MTDYPYPHFMREILLADLAFRGGPLSGDQMPGFDLVTTNSSRLRKRDFHGRQPLLLTCASITCPMTMTATGGLKRLYADFGDRVAFVTLYVREAHPGEHYPQPATFEEKLTHAPACQTAAAIHWTAAVDARGCVPGRHPRDADDTVRSAWLAPDTPRGGGRGVGPSASARHSMVMMIVPTRLRPHRRPIVRSISFPSRRTCAQVSGSARISPLSSAVIRRLSASRMIRRCNAWWNGTPK